jgi:hypothetical protein
MVAGFGQLAHPTRAMGTFGSTANMKRLIGYHMNILLERFQRVYVFATPVIIACV